MSDKGTIYLSWAPPQAIWSKWAKPVLFAYMEASPPAIRAGEAITFASAPPAGNDTALVLDLPGAQGVMLGLEMARQGYRPVPLYSACPWGESPGLMLLDPSEVYKLLSSTGSRRRFPPPVIDLVPVISAIYHHAATLDRLALPPEAPPAFLLDARRRGGKTRPAPGMFDNRSVVSTGDFPPAEFLKGRGIRRAILIQREGEPRQDLLATLRQWQSVGIEILLQKDGQSWQPHPLKVPGAAIFRDLWYSLSNRMSLRRGEQGFGGLVPESSGPIFGKKRP